MTVLEADPDVAAIVLTGRRKVFMTGADLREIAALETPAAASEYMELPHEILAQLCRSKKIIIAAINGYCLGGGLELALACDYRLAVDRLTNAKGDDVPFLGFPETRLGLIPAACGAYLAAAVVGLPQAAEMFCSAEPLLATHALRIGLVNALAPAATLADEALRTASAMSANSLHAIALTKALLYRQRNGELDEVFRETRTAFADCCAAGDMRQRISALQAERLGQFRNSVAAGAIFAAKA